MKIVLDTNIFISGLFFPKSNAGRLVNECLAGKFELCLSDDLIKEISKVLAYPKIRKRLKLSDLEIDNYCSLLKFHCHFFETKIITAKVPKDCKDDHVLATLIASEANYLISGDDDLLSLSKSFPIISLKDFVEKFMQATSTSPLPTSQLVKIQSSKLLASCCDLKP